MQGLNATYFLGVPERGRGLYQTHFPAHIVCPLNTTQQTPKIPVIHARRKSVIRPLSVFIFLLLFSEPGWKDHSQCFLKSALFVHFSSRLLKLMVNRHPYQPRGHGPARFLLCMWFIFSFVDYQTQISARPSPDRDFESRNLYCSLSLCDK